ncbi:MAG TPA: nucleoid-associated protein [Thermoanaerobaculia bacterium]|jgi:hypothetical protein|nr:nucleoid-associated protein [Thermoanaerobaculia bacterium]
MRKTASVTVQRAIVHIVDHQQPAPFLSEAELTLSDNPALQDYFSAQAQNALGDEQTHSAHFEKKDGSPEASDACFRILDDGSRFVAASQDLARLLHGAMGTDQRIASGSLAVCLVTAENGKASDYLALFKLDPGRGLVQRIEKLHGKRVVSFDVASDVMPPPEKLQKAALVPPRDTQKKFDLLLLDRQAAAGTANFFAVRFLNAKLVLDEKTSTKSLYSVGIKTIERMTAEAVTIPREAAEVVREQFKAAILGKSVNVQQLVEQLPEEAQEIAQEEILRKFPHDKRIRLDPVYAQETLLRKSRFRGDFGVSFEVNADREGDVIESTSFETLPDGTEVAVLRLRVPNWRRL